MKAEVLRLKRGRDARARVHPWIFKGDVADVTDVEPGTAVTVVDSGGRFVGRGFYNPRPALCCRIRPWTACCSSAGSNAPSRFAHAAPREGRRPWVGWCGAKPTGCPVWSWTATG